MASYADWFLSNPFEIKHSNIVMQDKNLRFSEFKKNKAVNYFPYSH